MAALLTEEEIQELKGEIKESKKRIKKKEEEIDEAKKEGYEPACDNQILVELLREKNILEEKLLRSQGGAGPGPSSQAELEEAVLRALKRARGSSIALSRVGSIEWQHIQTASQLEVVAQELLGMELPAEAVSDLIPLFQWSGEAASQQSERYMEHLRGLFQLSEHANCKLAWLECGSKYKDLLTVVSDSGRLHYSKLSGNTDAAIVTSASLELELASMGLCILFELKKQPSRAAMCQAMCQLLCSNILSRHLGPVVVLTDLREDWRLLYMDGTRITASKLPTRAAAVVLIRGLIRLAEAGVRAPAGAAALPLPPGMPLAVAQRQPAPLFAGSADVGAVASLADLAGLLPDEELRTAQASHTLAQLLRLPQLSCITTAGRSDVYPARMYA